MSPLDENPSVHPDSPSTQDTNNSFKYNIKTAFMAAFPLTLPILAGFVVLGVAYGILMQSKGYGPLWSALMSAVIFGGSIQMAAIALFTAPFNPLPAFILSFLVNARHIFYGVSVLTRYKGLGKFKPFLIFTLCDETFSIVSSVKPPEHVEPRYFYFAISSINYLYWVSATFLGGLIGSSMAIETKGLDFVLSALFVVLLLEQIYRAENRLPALIGFVGSCLGLAVAGPDSMVIPSMGFLLIGLLLGKKLCR